MNAAKMLEIVTKIHSLTQKGVQISEITKLMINEQQQLMRKHIDPNDEKDESIQTNVCLLCDYTRSVQFIVSSQIYSCSSSSSLICLYQHAAVYLFNACVNDDSAN